MELYFFGVPKARTYGHAPYDQNLIPLDKEVRRGLPFRFGWDSGGDNGDPTRWTVSRDLLYDDGEYESYSDQGRARMHWFEGWSILAFWDRTGDHRGGSMSCFLASEILSFDELVAAAREAYPTIWKRFTFDVVDTTPTPPPMPEPLIWEEEWSTTSLFIEGADDTEQRRLLVEYRQKYPASGQVPERIVIDSLDQAKELLAFTQAAVLWWESQEG